MRREGNVGIAGGWEIEGPSVRPPDEVHVYAYQGNRMIGMLDCELCESGRVRLRMAYVLPSWRGSAVLRDMLVALRRHYRQIGMLRRRHRSAAR